ncbi:DUF421 domain-containing protein [Granulicoccus phenolivorans]|uniref:DUF421 domain-containing protein n=1 Tax=Granulicoccus phenolivorans TaxID=266854 RepID=UPI000416454F|nr:YetF domain-containing protein [Granulicoccus phenolivorans]
MWHDLAVMDMSVWEKIARTILVYAGIALIIRLFGKRLMAQMNSMDLVVVLLLSNVVQNAIIGNDNTVAGGLLGAIVLVLTNVVVDWAMHRSPRLERLLVGRPTTVITDGRLDERALHRLGITRGELRHALHNQGADTIGEVKQASIEPAGSVVVDLNREDQAVSRGELVAELTALREHLDAAIARAGRS